MAKLVTKRAKRNLVQRAFNRVGNNRQIPMLEIPKIWKAGETAIDDLTIANPTCTEADLIAAAASALDTAITAVEVKR
jgi:thiamine biosynthesis lipoprotein ApbE